MQVRKRLLHMLADLDGIDAVAQAADAPGARAVARWLKPDVTILDTLDSSGDWVGLLQFLKASRPDSKVVMLTNFVEPEYREMSLRNGADFFFDKSMEFAQAVEVIRGLRAQGHAG